jgi:hypothetical protein
MAKADESTARRRTVHDQIAGAQRALVEARGRLLEARCRAQLEAVLASLHRAVQHVNEAAASCVVWIEKEGK